MKKWGTVLEGTDTNPHPQKKGYNKKWALLFPLLMVGRRLLFVIAVIAMPHFLLAQLGTLFACITANIIYLL